MSLKVNKHIYFLHTKSIVKKINTDFTLNNCLFGSAKRTKNADWNKYKYTGYGIAFDCRSEVSFTDRRMGKKSH